MTYGPLHLAIRHARVHWAQTVILFLCIATTVFIPVTASLAMRSYEADLRSRAEATPLIVGSNGSRFDLTFAALYFQSPDIEPVRLGVVDEINATGEAVAIPISARFKARGHPIAGVGFEYFDRRGLVCEAGALPIAMGDAVLGSNVASSLAMGVGDTLYSDQRNAYDLAKPSALQLSVTGVLEHRGTPDDDAVFVDIGTIWILEGEAHAHRDAASVADDKLIGRTDDHIVVSGAMIEDNAMSDENLGSFHIHGDPDRLPLSAALVFPRTEKARTILQTRVNANPAYQMVAPTRVIDDLMEFVVRIKSLVDTIATVLAFSTVGLIFLVTLLSVRVRSPERSTLHRIGCARSTVVKMFAYELGLIVVAGAVVGTAVGAGAVHFLPTIAQLT